MRIGILAAVCLLSIPMRAENPVKEGQDKFNLAVECIKRFEGWHGERKHWPYVGWGHKVLPGEKFTNNISKAQGDSILRADLRKLCRMFGTSMTSMFLSDVTGARWFRASSAEERWNICCFLRIRKEGESFSLLTVRFSLALLFYLLIFP